MTLREWSLLLSLSALWGGSFFFAKIAVAELGPLTVVLGRVALAAVCLNTVLALSGRSLMRENAPWSAFFVMGTLNNLVPFALIFWAQTHIASGLASILNATTPLFTVIVAHLLTPDEKMTGGKITGALAGLAGVAVLVGPDALRAFDAGVWGELACLGAALSYAFAGIYGRRFKAMKVAPLEAAAGQVTATSILILPIVLVFEAPWNATPWPGSETWGALIGLAVLSTALAYVLYFRILATVGATNLLLVTFLIPVTAILLGTAFLGERLEVRQVAGMALIALGLAAIDGRAAAAIRPAK